MQQVKKRAYAAQRTPHRQPKESVYVWMIHNNERMYKGIFTFRNEKGKLKDLTICGWLTLPIAKARGFLLRCR